MKKMSTTVVTWVGLDAQAGTMPRFLIAPLDRTTKFDGLDL
jgi:hypothetical protein